MCCEGLHLPLPEEKKKFKKRSSCISKLYPVSMATDILNTHIGHLEKIQFPQGTFVLFLSVSNIIMLRWTNGQIVPAPSGEPNSILKNCAGSNFFFFMIQKVRIEILYPRIFKRLL
jgi:hypothetical protein